MPALASLREALPIHISSKNALDKVPLWEEAPPPRSLWEVSAGDQSLAGSIREKEAAVETLHTLTFVSICSGQGNKSFPHLDPGRHWGPGRGHARSNTLHCPWTSSALHRETLWEYKIK